MSQAILFVQFKNAERANSMGFNPTYSYPVYHTDVIEEEEGLKCNFLIANREGDFAWVSMADVKRVKGQARDETRKFGGGRSREDRYSKPGYPPPLRQTPVTDET